MVWVGRVQKDHGTIGWLELEGTLKMMEGTLKMTEGTGLCWKCPLRSQTHRMACVWTVLKDHRKCAESCHALFKCGEWLFWVRVKDYPFEIELRDKGFPFEFRVKGYPLGSGLSVSHLCESEGFPFLVMVCLAYIFGLWVKGKKFLFWVRIKGYGFGLRLKVKGYPFGLRLQLTFNH